MLKSSHIGDLESAPRFKGRGLEFVAAILLILGILAGALAGWLTWQDRVESERNAHFAIALERLLSAMKDLETSQRGYLLTGQEEYLEPYSQASDKLEGLLADVESLGFPTGDLEASVTARRDASAKAIAEFRAAGKTVAPQMIRSGVGKRLMDQLRTTVADMEQQSDDRKAAARRHEALVALPIGIAAALVVLLAFGALWLLSLRRRRSQKASTTLLAGVLDNAPVGLGFLDADLKVQHMNRALITMSERALSASIGQSIWDVLPQMREALASRLLAVVQGGPPVSNLEVQAESNRRPDQTRAFQVSFYPLLKEGRNGVTEGAGMVVSDITSRKRSEQRLKDSEERFRTLIKAAANIVWLTDAAGDIERPQPEWAAFTDQKFDDYKGMGWLKAVHPDDVEAVSEAWTRAVASRANYAFEHRLRRADGAWRHVAATAVPILDEDGAPREWIGSYADITDRKEQQIELAAAKNAAESANRAKSVFLANMSHELRTPLSAVIGYSEMMEEEIEDLGEQGLLTDLGKIKSNARHLLSLINDVLDLSKIEANRMDVFAEDVDVSTLVSEAAATVETLVHRKGNRLVVDPHGELGRMSTDVVKLRQCLFNLLSNAAKFTENGTVTLAVRREPATAGDVLVFDVTDTGIGMTADQLQRLFQRFAQADETTTRRFGGTGLGLAITRAFCKLLGGDVEVRSREGQGTTFTIRVPAVMPEQDATALDGGSEPVPTARGVATREAVLVIDDDAAQRDLMSRFLERQGFAAFSAGDGPAGLELARAVKPRAILLDVMMPRMDGWSVLTAIKADPEIAFIPVVMVTFLADTGLGAALGAADYLTKPVRWDRLKQLMDRFKDAEGDVLLVDDDPDARYRLKTVLERNGWTTQEAGNGKEALEKVALATPRIILLDLTMPVMDGFSFLHALRERPGCGDIPVIVLTARDITAEDRLRLETADRVYRKGETSLAAIEGELRSIVATESEGAGSSHAPPGSSPP